MFPALPLFAEAGQVIPQLHSSTTSLTLALVGDINLDETVGRLIEKHGPLFPISEMKARLSQADIILGNLECPLTLGGKKQDKEWSFRAKPEAAKLLQDAGFTIVSLANNHTMDYGPEGLLDTIYNLDVRGILHIGAGANREEAEKPVFIEKNSIKVGFLAFTSTFPEEAWAEPDSGADPGTPPYDHPGWGARRAPPYPGGGKPGVAYSDFKRFPQIIQETKRACDFLVVSFHGGTELDAEPNDIQKAFARDATRAGADVVVCHHPHVLQPVSRMGESLVMYSLGNFLFVSPTPETRLSAVGFVEIVPGRPPFAQFLAVNTNWGQPVPASIEEREEIRRILGGFASILPY